ncbi:MAG TPA: beta-propeller fold lactonase family protein [Anaeromyxobacteraceae bacterium]|nr:beta-propeller fold lactonase family protein [Anaeromyxobacteraceae bacterium]
MLKRTMLAVIAVVSVVVLGCDGDETPPPRGSFVYVANSDDSTISIFGARPAGYLELVETIAAGSGPTGFVTDPSGTLLFVANSDAPGGTWGGVGTVSSYAIDGTSGRLTGAAGSPYSANTMALNIAVTPDGRFVYATNQFDFEVTVMAVGTGGVLTETAFSPIPVFEAHAIAMHPSGEFFYVGSEAGDIHALDLDPATGEFIPLAASPYTGVGAANWVVITPDGRYLYTADANNGAIAQVDAFSISATTGELTELAGFPLALGVNTGIKSLAVTPDGQYLYLARWNDASVGAYAIGVDGSLTAVPGQPFESGDLPKSIAIDANSEFAYVANYGSDSVTAFAIDGATGALTRLATYPVGAGPKMVLAVR